MSTAEIYVTCHLPDYMGRESLSRALGLGHNQTTGLADTLMIHGEKWSLPLTNDVGLVVRFDWSRVMYFDDAALLHLVLIQQSILGQGVDITHFPKNQGDWQKLDAQGDDFVCHKHVLRQLGAMGYFKYWLSEAFGADTGEAYRLTAVNSLRGLPPLSRPDDNLPVTACQSAESLAPGSPEDMVLRRYEEDAAIHTFTRQDTTERQQRRLIANGQFGQLIIRQCRKNTIEHAIPFTGGLSIARIVRRCDIARDWNLSFKDWEQCMPGPLSRLLSRQSEDQPVLDMTVIDDGCGIPATIETTWVEHVLRQTRAWRRVDSIAGSDWPHEAKLIEFALDKDVSRKGPEWRSFEKSGLGRIAELVSQDDGVFEVSSGFLQVLHDTGASPTYAKVNRPLDRGTAVRIVLPLVETPVSDRVRRVSQASASALVGGISTDRDKSLRPWKLICLRNLWDSCAQASTPIYLHDQEMEGSSSNQASDGNSDAAQEIQSLKTDIAMLVSSIRESIQDAEGKPSVAVLDWAELPWAEHEASSFLEKVASSIREEGQFDLTIVHINVPKALLLLSENAVRAYTETPRLPTCVFLEGGDEWYWLGLPSPDRGWGNLRLLTNDPEVKDETVARYLRSVFDGILTGRDGGRVLHGPQGSRDTALGYVGATDLFKETEARDYTGGVIPSGRFAPKLSYEELRSVIAGTFISILRAGLESDSCSFSPPLKKTKGKSRKSYPGLVRLPNGTLVERFYHCDGLLDYAPDPRANASEADLAVARERFRHTFVTHIVDLARVLEAHTPGRFDLVVSCTSPTHWFVHQLADGLSDATHQCGHFVGTTAASFVREFKASQAGGAKKVLVFTDVVSSGGLVEKMVKTLDDVGCQVKGLIGLLNTKTTDESGRMHIDDELTSMIDRRNTAVLVHIPVTKRKAGKVGWRVDPETLEPIRVVRQDHWTDGLAGIGPMGMAGRDVANWLEAFDAVRQGHLTHGGHHSEFVCDVKHLLTRPEVRTPIIGRLKLYIRKNEIDMIVYPNHSNAYLMADMIRELYGSDSQSPTMRVALCRNAHGERSYVLPRTSATASPKNVMLLDDGFVTGGTIRSLAATVSEEFPRIKEIHAIVLVSEMTSTVARYWTTLSTTEAFVPRSARRPKRAFLAPELNFSSVMSLPNHSHAKANCPLCRQQKEYLRNCEDEAKTVYEREFFRLWARELTPRDVYHDPNLDGTDTSVEMATCGSSNTDKSRDALIIAQFEMLLPTTEDPRRLLAETSEYALPVRIHCLRRFMNVYGTVSYALREGAWRQLLEVVSHDGTDIHNRVLAIRACIAEQVAPPSFVEFCELLTASTPHLADPLVLGGVMAFTRLAFAPGRLSAPWGRDNISEVISQMQKQASDPDVQSHLTSLLDWMTGVSVVGVGSAVLSFRKALFSRPGHPDVGDNVKTLSDYLRYLSGTSSVDAMLRRAVVSATMRVIDRFGKLERGARVLLPYAPTHLAEEWQHLSNKTQSNMEVLGRLMGRDLSADPAGTRRIAYDVDAAVASLKSMWLATETGCARILLEPFFHPVRPFIEEAIKAGEKEYADRFPQHRVMHDYDGFIEGVGASVEVLCHPSILEEAIRNVVSNIWKHVVPHSVKMKQDTVVTWSCEIKPLVATIRVVDNGPGVIEDDDHSDGDGGYATITPSIEEYEGVYCVQANCSGGAQVTLQLHCREITP